MTEKEGTKTKAHCNQCNGKTNHLLLKEHEKRYEEADVAIQFAILECCGCETIKVRREIHHYDDVQHDESTGEVDYYIETSYFPSINKRSIPEWHWNLSSLAGYDVYQLFQEAYWALGANANRLAVMGARAILDTIMNDIVGDIGGFEQKLKQMTSEGYISPREQEILKIMVVETGNASSHRSWNPKDETVQQVFDAVENLIHKIFILESQKEKVRVSTPVRQKKK